MTNESLARAYLSKAQSRLRMLAFLQQEEAWSDVVREAQEVVELALKGMLRQVGVEPPHWHDVGEILRQYRARYDDAVAAEIDRLAAASGWLRKEREFSFYGDIDFIPTERYTRGDADRALSDAEFVVSVAARAIV